MPLSESSKAEILKSLKNYYEWLRSLPEDELIQHWEVSTGDYIDDTVYWATCDVRIPIRDIIEERGLAEKVKEMDKRLIRYVLENFEYIDVPEDDREALNPPLSRWWWYLDLISQKQYPAELLPEELREGYLLSS